MSYDYQTERQFVFTERGQVTFLKIRDQAKKLLREAGAASCEKIISTSTGDSWGMLACVDRLVELGEIHELQNTLSRAGQDRIFIAAKADEEAGR